jgi:glycosyltransferase involved in cell wall biosynthesis
MKVIISHPTGNQNSRNAVLALEKNELLEMFYTSIGIFDDNFLNKIKIGPFSEISRRSYASELRGKTKFHPNLELLRLLAIKFKFTKLYGSYDSKYSLKNVFEDFDSFVANNLSYSHADSVFAYAGTAYFTFQEATKFNMFKIYEQHGCYWKGIEEATKNEIEKNPEWANSINSPFLQKESQEKLELELDMADKILVASQFCANSLPLSLKNKISIIPYGFPKVIDNRMYVQNKKIKILFVGNLSQMKGLSYLFDAVSPYRNHIELSLIGSLPNNPVDILAQNLKNYNYLGTMSNDQVLVQMKLHDVLLFPTLLDAFGMVITEAMAQGTPVITTTSSAGPELIDHQKDGWIVPPRSSDSIKEIIESLLLNRNLTKDLGQNAITKSKHRSWLNYQAEIANLILNINKY